MASLRTLFLGIYSSQSIIRVLFLPVCYVLLLSPFLTLAGYYLGFGRKLKAYIPEDLSWFDLLPQIALITVVVLLPTRLLSGFGTSASKTHDGKRRIQQLPYWIPGFRHFWDIATGGEAWLKGVRDSTFESIVAYNACGIKHYVVLNDSLTENSIMAQISKHLDQLDPPRTTKWALLRNAFIMSGHLEKQYFDIENALQKTVVADLYDELLPLMSSTLNALSESLPDFVTFNSSIVDQMQWERVAEVELSDGTSEAECNLFALVNEFCCNAILPPILGAQFTESYQLLGTDLASLNSRFWALALGLPRLSPIQGLPGAALAQKRLIHNFTRMFGELTNPAVRRIPDDDESVSGDEMDADVVTPVMKLNKLFTEHDLPLAARASLTLQLVHDIVAEVVPLVFWTLLHVYASSDGPATEAFEVIPTDKIIAETKPWARAFQPPSIHPSFPSPPAITFDPTFSQLPSDLTPYLDSCINESRRLYSCSAQTYQLTAPITVSDPNSTTKQDTWLLDANSHIDIGLSQSLLNSSPSTFPSPQTFQPARFTNIPASHAPTSPSHPYKSALTRAILTGLLHLWHLAPAPKKSFFDHLQEAREEAQIGAAPLTNEQKATRTAQLKAKREKEGNVGTWIFPSAREGASIGIPSRDVRVRIRRRERLPAGGFGMRNLG